MADEKDGEGMSDQDLEQLAASVKESVEKAMLAAISRVGPAIGKEFVVLLSDGKIRRATVELMILDQMAGISVHSVKRPDYKYNDTVPVACLLAPYSDEAFAQYSQMHSEAQKSLSLHLYAKTDTNEAVKDVDGLAGKFIQQMPKAVQ